MKYRIVLLVPILGCQGVLGIHDVTDLSESTTTDSSSADSTAESSSGTSSSVAGTGGASSSSVMSSSSSGNGGNGGASVSSSSSNVSSSASGNPCMPKRTCATEGQDCGPLDDGCQIIDCGPYVRFSLCDQFHMPAYTCACPDDAQQHIFDFTCKKGNTSNGPPPYADCIQNPPANQTGWCCSESKLPP